MFVQQLKIACMADSTTCNEKKYDLQLGSHCLPYVATYMMLMRMVVITCITHWILHVAVNPLRTQLATQPQCNIHVVILLVEVQWCMC